MAHTAAAQKDTKQVKKLSGNVLSLKFMHRAQEAKYKQQLEDSKRKVHLDSQWNISTPVLKDSYMKSIPKSLRSIIDLDMNSNNKIDDKTSDIDSKNIIGDPLKHLSKATDKSYALGRKSFGNFNKEINILTDEYNKEKDGKDLDERVAKDDLNADNMLATSTFAQESRKSFKNKRSREYESDEEDNNKNFTNKKNKHSSNNSRYHSSESQDNKRSSNSKNKKSNKNINDNHNRNAFFEAPGKSDRFKHLK